MAGNTDKSTQSAGPSQDARSESEHQAVSKLDIAARCEAQIAAAMKRAIRDTYEEPPGGYDRKYGFEKLGAISRKIRDSSGLDLSTICAMIANEGQFKVVIEVEKIRVKYGGRGFNLEPKPNTGRIRICIMSPKSTLQPETGDSHDTMPQAKDAATTTTMAGDGVKAEAEPASKQPIGAPDLVSQLEALIEAEKLNVRNLQAALEALKIDAPYLFRQIEAQIEAQIQALIAIKALTEAQKMGAQIQAREWAELKAKNAKVAAMSRANIIQLERLDYLLSVASK
ncbi:uncharacterized protein BP5553_09254 [Venustampulla echinocandica]|uniref:Uncharacterized protein n=1 Tax=Venustampulla echinocandica TaxID=2656787 RepID=A0A370TC92_9HELO|nr:uncharacterized protein BP5553_09254 [Venustampulla echinocandica]RDL31852.1 hypothetical protein BP5553_09254 [Venustampulla echinocandica]